MNPQIIENAVPAVLDSAVAALAEESNRPITDPASMNIAVISPTPASIHASGALTPTHLGSPIGLGLRPQTLSRGSKVRNASQASGPNSVVGGSRSPSPTRRSFSVSVPPTNASPGSQSPRMTVERQNSIPASVSQLVPGAFGLGSGLGSASPTQASSTNVSPQMSPLSNIMSLSPQAQDGMPPFVGTYDPHGGTSHSPSHSQGGLSPLINNASKRLSFVSYSDILNSAPLSAVPFSSIITSEEPPPHIPAVLGSTSEVPASGSSAIGASEGEWLGGEYEREGFGRGLEARLEAVLNMEKETSQRAGSGASPELNATMVSVEGHGLAPIVAQ